MTKLICIDSGHGAEDRGAQYNYADEANINLGVALFLEYELLDKGFLPILTRHNDLLLSLTDRTILTNEIEADLFISIHCDAFEDHTVCGKRIHHYRNSVEGARLAQSIAYQFDTYLEQPTYIPKTKIMMSNFQVLRDTRMPAVLCECGYMTNYDECEKLKKIETQREIAVLICKGIVNYCG